MDYEKTRHLINQTSREVDNLRWDIQGPSAVPAKNRKTEKGGGGLFRVKPGRELSFLDEYLEICERELMEIWRREELYETERAKIEQQQKLILWKEDKRIQGLEANEHLKSLEVQCTQRQREALVADQQHERITVVENHVKHMDLAVKLESEEQRVAYQRKTQRQLLEADAPPARWTPPDEESQALEESEYQFQAQITYEKEDEFLHLMFSSSDEGPDSLGEPTEISSISDSSCLSFWPAQSPP